jgi:putative Ig domain-containing protein
LTISSSGAISGVPRRAGTYTVSARVVDANGAVGNVQVRLVVRPRLTIAAKALPGAKAGHAYNAKISVRGGVTGLRWSISRGTLPAGLRLGATTGTITGVPRSAGSFRVTVRVRDSLGAVSSKTLLLSVH